MKELSGFYEFLVTFHQKEPFSAGSGCREQRGGDRVSGSTSDGIAGDVDGETEGDAVTGDGRFERLQQKA